MRRARPSGLFFLTLSLVALASAAAEQPGPTRPERSDKPPAKKDRDKTEKPPAALPGLSILPPDAVIAIFGDPDDVLRTTPRGIFQSTERYRAEQEELARLRKLLERPAPQTPTRLLLKGKVEGNVVVLQAQFEFETSEPGAVVRLGCGQAVATAVSLDGKTARLLPPGRAGSKGGDDEGFSVAVDKPGEHQLTLDLMQGLAPRTAGQGFVLDLPRAPITRLELDLPANPLDVRLGGKPLTASSLVTLKGNQVAGNLGAADRLELDWKSAQPATAAAVLAVDGQVQVHLGRVRPGRNELTTRAQLTLRVQAGQTRQWQLLVPGKALVQVAAADLARVGKIERKALPLFAQWTIDLKERTSDPLSVTVTTPAVDLRPGAKTTIGPFNVPGAVRQSGTVLVSNNVPDVHVEALPLGDLTRRAATEEELARDRDLVAAFRYGPDGGERGAALAWLGLEAESVSGQLRAQLEHTLSLETEGRRWQVQTVLKVTPRSAGIDRFVVRMPPGCELDPNSLVLPEGVRSGNYDPAARTLDFRLTPGTRPLTSIRIPFTGIYTNLEVGTSGTARLALPRPQSLIDPNGTIVVKVPTDTELSPPDPKRSAGMELAGQNTHELKWRYPRRLPESIEVDWKGYRPAVQTLSVVHLVLGRGQAQVRQTVTSQVPSGTTGPPRVTLDKPEGVRNFRSVKGGQEVEYGFDWNPHPRNGDLVVPLAVPQEATQGETQVLIFSEPGQLPRLSGNDWTVQNIEVVPGHDQLPVLVVRSPSIARSLTLRIRSAEPEPRVRIERVLVRVEVGAGGIANYRVSYRLGDLSGDHLDFELPAPVLTINLLASLGGKRLGYETLAEKGDTGRASPSRLVRLRLSGDLVRRLPVLELSYQLSPRPDRTPLTMTLAPPRPVDEAGNIPARWQVTAPPGWIVVSPEPDPGSPQAWGWQRGLLAPRSRLSGADLEAWFDGSESAGDPSTREAPAAVPTLVLWHDAAEPLTLTHLPWRAWLVGCSLALVVLGLVLSRLALSAVPGRSAWAWAMGGVVVLAGLAVVALAPGLAAQVAYGCQPGLLVLVLILLAQWMLHERYRRQIIFLPSFSRSRSSSSVLRPGSKPLGEPSTVDVAPPAGSSVERGV
jgi:hypothetical protein